MAATLMLASDENPEWVAKVLGHANTDMLFRVHSRFVLNVTGGMAAPSPGLQIALIGCMWQTIRAHRVELCIAASWCVQIKAVYGATLAA